MRNNEGEGGGGGYIVTRDRDPTKYNGAAHWKCECGWEV